MQEIAERAKFKRLEQNLTQEGLALRSGVSLGSIKRFERSGEISLKSLIDIALALGCLEDFSALFADNAPRGSLFESKNEIECFFECLRQAALRWDFRGTGATYLF